MSNSQPPPPYEEAIPLYNPPPPYEEVIVAPDKVTISDLENELDLRQRAGVYRSRHPQRDNGEWPPNSPDLNVMDYSIWSILEAEACSKPHQSIDALRKNLTKAWNNISQDFIDRVVDDFPKRLKKCIEADGGHFENN
uniref:Uncharacterized protein n=1 Tax=Acrobeloides nanus TaxID=290746 RepID=A0A914DCP2_9BILA